MTEKARSWLAFAAFVLASLALPLAMYVFRK